MIPKKPIFLRFRSCNLYVMVTVSMSLFTDMLVYSIIVPIMPFAIDAMNNGKSPHSAVDPYHSEIKDGAAVSQDTGLLLTLFAVGLLIGSPILGYTADRMKHRKIPMIAGIAGLLGATFLFLFAETYWELLLARFLQGFSDACVWTLGMCLVADTFPIDEIGTQMGRVLLWHSVGLCAGSPIGALYQKVGYQGPFILCIVLAGVDLLLRIGLVERRNRPVEWFEKDMSAPTIIAPSTVINNLNGDSDSIAEKMSNQENKHHHVGVLQLLRQHRLLAGMLLAFANGCVFNVFEPTMPIRLSNEWGYDSGQIGLVFLAQVIPTFVATPLSGFLTDKYGPKVVCFTNLIICATSLFLIGIPNRSTAGGIVPMIVIFAIQGFSAFSFITPVLSEMAHVVQGQNPDGGDSGQGMSYALFNIAFALGGLVGPLAGGYLFATVGFFYMCLIMGVFLLLCGPYVFFFTGPNGKFIIRPQDKNSLVADEETNVVVGHTEAVTINELPIVNVAANIIEEEEDIS